MNRREFIAGAGASVLLTGCATKGMAAVVRAAAPKMMWANYLRLGSKMWEKKLKLDHLEFEYDAWKKITDRMAERKLNVVVWDLGEGLAYPSHPELAVKGSWDPERVREEVARLGKMGIVSVPKLNFSAGHDQWLGKWRDYLSTPEYFEVCHKLIADVANVFNESPLFHLGYDEETYFIQNINKFQYIRIRRGDLWWHDFEWFVKEVESHGMRPWIWSDFYWHNSEAFLKRMPKSVLQTNWYYGKEFDPSKMKESRRKEVTAYEAFEKAGYDQVPCGSIYECDSNFPSTVAHCRNMRRINGFLMASWTGPTTKGTLAKQLKAVDIVGREIEKWNV